MIRKDVEILETITRPGKYLAQLNGLNIHVKNIRMPGNYYIYYIESRCSITNETRYHHIESINTEEVFLLPIRKTLKQFIEGDYIL